MPLPLLTEDGDLPIGVHQATLPEVLDRFGVGSAQRLALTIEFWQVKRDGGRRGIVELIPAEAS